MTDDPAAAAETYFISWKARDFQTLRVVLADPVTLRGPVGGANDADACTRGLQRMAENLDRRDRGSGLRRTVLSPRR